MSNINSNVSSLFNSLNAGGANNTGSMGSFDFANYAAIKNGSYGKLVKSYYAEQKAPATADTVSNKASAAKKAKTASADIDKTGLDTVKKDADKLRTSAEALTKEDLWKKTDGKADTEKITGAVKDFADSYNKLIDASSKVSSKEVAQDMKFMTQMTDTFSNILNRVGVSVGEDGKLSVNEDKLKNVDTATAKSLFTQNLSYGSQIADKAASVMRDADLNSSIYGSDAALSSALSSVYNQWI